MEIKVKGQKLRTVTSVKYLKAVLDENLKLEFYQGLHKSLQLFQN